MNHYQERNNNTSIEGQAVASTKLSSIEVALCGAAAGAVSRFVASPLDVIKIRLQLQSGRSTFELFSGQKSLNSDRKYNGAWHALKLIVREEGVRGLWKGNLSAEYLYLSYSAVQFLTYQQMQTLFTFIEKKHGKPIIDKTLQPFLSGAVCGTTATVATYPFDLLRTRFAAQGNVKVYKGMSHAIRQIYSKEGTYGFYRGISASVLQIIPYMSLMFGSYEIFKKSFRRLEEKNLWGSNLKGSEDLLCGAIAGVISKTGVFPLDLLRKRLQIFIQDGFFGLYKGLTPALIKSAPVSAVTFFVFGQTKKLFEKLHGN
ncbi:9925_t:CDS:2 [Acaulospora morrowiae]|uniref:9925_t:CDS:1 n=1 Tax=Acaulospora morrowiae TaxID=94023 RepID=A0A9N9DT05_9GLOM|nr:9925_t:CDS:2 [Acaulospora morrowiae]